MSKVVLDINAFKALASETRLEILRALDERSMTLNELSEKLNLNKATVHEHLMKLHEAGLVKRKEREGHKWVYYKLSWKGSSLLHPDNTRIVVLFTAAIVALLIGIACSINVIWSQPELMEYDSMKNTLPMEEAGKAYGGTRGFEEPSDTGLFIPLISVIIFIILIVATIWLYRENKTPRL